MQQMSGYFIARKLVSFTSAQLRLLFNIRPIKPFILINPRDASQRDINKGHKVQVFNEKGSLILPAKISEKVPEGVVWTFRSPWLSLSEDKKNVNILTNDEFQSINYGSTFNSTFVDLKGL